METEQLAIKQLDASNKAIAQAISLLASMRTLKKKLHLSDGCGQRFLQKTNPNLALLQKAEKEINETYNSQQNSQQNSSPNKTELLNHIIRRGQA